MSCNSCAVCKTNGDLKTRLILLILLVSAAACYSQRKEKKKDLNPREKTLGIDLAWSDGSAMLNDGTELKGVLRFNENTGILSFEAGGDSRSLTARSSVGFEFYDVSQQRQRVYFSLEYANDEDVVVPMFFEALFQFKSFALLRKMGPIKIKEKSTPMSPTGVAAQAGGGTYTQIEQVETVYLMNARGEIKPFVEFTSKDRPSIILDSDRGKVMNEEFLEKLIGKQVYEKLRDYASEKDLRFRFKDELMEIFEYYQKELVK